MSDHIDTEALREEIRLAEANGISVGMIEREQLRALLDAYDERETLRKERDELRAALRNIATTVGGGLGPECTHDFHCRVADEVRLVVAELRRRFQVHHDATMRVEKELEEMEEDRDAYAAGVSILTQERDAERARADRAEAEVGRLRDIIQNTIILCDGIDHRQYVADKLKCALAAERKSDRNNCASVCRAGQEDGVTCADDECDRENGVRP
jgi:hypothetical protein